MESRGGVSLDRVVKSLAPGTAECAWFVAAALHQQTESRGDCSATTSSKCLCGNGGVRVVRPGAGYAK
jgi:uncharacterized membrane protein (UPF0136 family)